MSDPTERRFDDTDAAAGYFSGSRVEGRQERKDYIAGCKLVYPLTYFDQLGSMSSHAPYAIIRIIVRGTTTAKYITRVFFTESLNETKMAVKIMATNVPDRKRIVMMSLEVRETFFCQLD